MNRIITLIAESTTPPDRITPVGKALIAIGLLLVAAGLLWTLFPRALEWFGSLPGDVDVRRGNTRIFVPLGSMLLLSLGLTVLANLVAWLLRLLR